MTKIPPSLRARKALSRSQLLCCCLLMFALLGNVAYAAGSTYFTREFKRARKHYDKLQFPKAQAIFTKLAFRPGLTRQQRARVFLYQGFCMFYVRTPQEARRKFTIALKLDPKLRLPRQTPPPLRRLVALERSRLGIKPPPPPLPVLRFQIKPKAPTQPGRPISFRGSCTKRPFGARLFIKVRRHDATTYKQYRLQWQGTQCFGNVPNPYPPNYLGNLKIHYVFQAKRGIQNLGIYPPLTRPATFRWTTRRISKRTPIHPPIRPKSPKKKSNVGLAVGLTLGLAAVIGGGVALAVYLIDQPSGPSVKVRVNFTPSGD